MSEKRMKVCQVCCGYKHIDAYKYLEPALDFGLDDNFRSQKPQE